MAASQPGMPTKWSTARSNTLPASARLTIAARDSGIDQVEHADLVVRAERAGRGLVRLGAPGGDLPLDGPIDSVCGHGPASPPCGADRRTDRASLLTAGIVAPLVKNTIPAGRRARPDPGTALRSAGGCASTPQGVDCCPTDRRDRAGRLPRQRTDGNPATVNVCSQGEQQWIVTFADWRARA